MEKFGVATSTTERIRKSWSQLFENPYFMNMLRTNFLSNDHSYYNDTSLLLHYEPGMYSLSGERFDNKVKLDWPNPIKEEFEVGIHGSVSVNGILCFAAWRVEEEFQRVVLWNPATGEF